MKIKIGEIIVDMALNDINSKRAESFFDLYEFQHLMIDAPRKMFLGNKNPRTCRFCNKSRPEVNFKSDAHVIPQFMGNKNLLSYFECDTCNSIFSSYEDSFSNFVGASRTIGQYKLKPAHKVPKFKNIKTGLEIMAGENSMLLKVGEHTSNEVIIDDATKTLKVKTIRHPYVPIHVPKLISKMGYCSLPDSELSEYNLLREILISSHLDKKLINNTLFKVFIYFIPGPPLYPSPKVVLYNKKDKDSMVPQKQVVVHFLNYIYQMCLPFGEKDEWLKGKQASFPIYPLLVDDEYLKKNNDKFEEYYMDFSSDEKKIGEVHEMGFSFQERIREETINIKKEIK